MSTKKLAAKPTAPTLIAPVVETAVAADTQPPAPVSAEPAPEPATVAPEQTVEEFTYSLLCSRLSAATASCCVARVLEAVNHRFQVTISDTDGQAILTVHRDFSYRGPDAARGMAESLDLKLALDVNSAILAKFPAA
jgi:hypothetical protein